MARFDRQVQTALRLIKKNGQEINWQQVRNGNADPETPWLPGQSVTVDNKAVICFLPTNKATLDRMQVAPDVAIASFMGYMGQVSFDPNLKDVVIRNGEQLRIHTIDVLNPNGQNILYTVLFAK